MPRTQGGNSRRKTRWGKAFPDVRHTRNRSERQISRRRQRRWAVHGCSQRSTYARTLNRSNSKRLQFDSGALVKEGFTANYNKLVRGPTPAQRSDPVMQAQDLGEITVPVKKENALLPHDSVSAGGGAASDELFFREAPGQRASSGTVARTADTSESVGADKRHSCTKQGRRKKAYGSPLFRPLSAPSKPGPLAVDSRDYARCLRQLTRKGQGQGKTGKNAGPLLLRGPLRIGRRKHSTGARDGGTSIIPNRLTRHTKRNPSWFCSPAEFPRACEA